MTRSSVFLFIYESGADHSILVSSLSDIKVGGVEATHISFNKEDEVSFVVCD